MEGPSVLVWDSILPYTQLSSLCRSFTFSPVPLFFCVAFCQAGWLLKASHCCSLVYKIVPTESQSSEFFCLCLALFSASGSSYWHQFWQVYTCSNKNLTYGLKGWIQLLAGMGVCPGVLLHSREFICKLNLNIFSFFLFFFNWLTRKTLNCFLSGFFLKLWWCCHFLITSFLKGNYLCCEL